MKFECPTFLRSKGKTMAITLSDNEVSNHESGSDKDGNFIAFTTTVIVDESVVVKENPSDGELSKRADLQETFNKLCKVAPKDTTFVCFSINIFWKIFHFPKSISQKIISFSGV